MVTSASGKVQTVPGPLKFAIAMPKKIDMYLATVGPDKEVIQMKCMLPCERHWLLGTMG